MWPWFPSLDCLEDRGSGLLNKKASDSSGVAQTQAPHIDCLDLLPLIADFWSLVCARLEQKQKCGRLKQWLNFLRRRYPQAEAAYQELRTLNDPRLVDQWLARTMAMQAVEPAWTA